MSPARSSSVRDKTEAWRFWPQGLCFMCCTTLCFSDVGSATFPFLWLHSFRVAIMYHSEYRVPGHSDNLYGIFIKNWCVVTTLSQPLLGRWCPLPWPSVKRTMEHRDKQWPSPPLLWSPLSQGGFLAFRAPSDCFHWVLLAVQSEGSTRPLLCCMYRTVQASGLPLPHPAVCLLAMSLLN